MCHAPQIFEANTTRQEGPLPRGHLLFNGAFEGGNIGGTKRCEDGLEYEITLRHDTNNSKWVHALLQD